MKEAKVTINGIELTDAQIMSLRVAVGSTLLDKEFLEALGETGKLYKAKLHEILELLVR